MRVYYDSSLWSKRKGFFGTPQKVDWQFEYRGEKCFIPVLYHFSKGVVFDVIYLLDETKLRAFFEKYEAVEKALTPLQQKCAEQEHPYQGMSIKEIWIDGKRVESGWSSSSAVSMPWVQGDNLSHVHKVYASILTDADCFACQRFCMPYPKISSNTQKILRLFRLNKINRIKLSTQPVNCFFPLEVDFNIFKKEEEKEVCFVHPKTGIEHTLYFQNPEFVEIPMGDKRNQSFYAAQAMYEIKPDLPEGDYFEFNSGMQYTQSPKDRFSPAATSSIGIIGGACGTTAIFGISKNEESRVPCGLHGLPLHSCFSVPSFNKENTSRFVLEGIYIKEWDSQEYSFSV